VARLEPPLLVKPESLQPTGSFKLRGAYTAIMASEQAARQHGVVAHSSGNHGHAVAYAAALLGVRAVVVVPRTAPKVKTDAIEYYGAELVRVEPTLAARVAATGELADRHGYVPIPPFDDRAVIAGQGTVGLEIAADCPQVGLVLVPVSGGGLISGIAGCLKEMGRRVDVVACSPENSAVMHHSVRAGRIVEMESKPTLSDGTAGAVEPEAVTLDLCRRYVDRYVLISEDEIREAMRLVIDHHHTLVEGAAGVAVAGYLKEKDRYADHKVVIVLCGGNISRERLKEVL